MFDLTKENLIDKIEYLGGVFNTQIDQKKYQDDELDYSIKWSDGLKANLKKQEKVKIDRLKIIPFEYRPFFSQLYFGEKKFSDRLTSNHSKIFGENLFQPNVVITFSGRESSKPFSSLATNHLFGFDFLEKTQCLPHYRYTSTGERIDNITDWGLQKFKDHYLGDETKKDTFRKQWRILHPPAWTESSGFDIEEVGEEPDNIRKIDIFHYVYAVLHNPAYRKKYELNLKREFPRIPFYQNFPQWVIWGKQLMHLHINYETVEPYPLKQLTTDYEAKNMAAWESFKKAKLKADRDNGTITLDGFDKLQGIPKEAWEYKLGNRSALEWILNQYKEKKPSDPTIAEKFNTYKFAGYKDKVIDLLKRVCTVSVETIEIVKDMGGNK